MEHLREEIEEEEEEVESTAKDDNMLEMKIEELDLTVRSFQLLKESWNRRSWAACKTYFKRSSKDKILEESLLMKSLKK